MKVLFGFTLLFTFSYQNEFIKKINMFQWTAYIILFSAQIAPSLANKNALFWLLYPFDMTHLSLLSGTINVLVSSYVVLVPDLESAIPQKNLGSN